MIRIGLVGIGFMGMIHYLAAASLRAPPSTALCSRDRKKLAGDWTGIRGNFGPPGDHMDLGAVHATTTSTAFSPRPLSTSSTFAPQPICTPPWPSPRCRRASTSSSRKPSP